MDFLKNLLNGVVITRLQSLLGFPGYHKNHNHLGSVVVFSLLLPYFIKDKREWVKTMRSVKRGR